MYDVQHAAYIQMHPHLAEAVILTQLLLKCDLCVSTWSQRSKPSNAMGDKDEEHLVQGV